MIADTRQIEERHLLELEHRFLLGGRQVLQIRVFARVIRRAAQVVVPVRARLDVDRLAGNQRHGPGRRLIIHGRRLDQIEILIRKGFVVIIDDRQVWVMEDIAEALDLACALQFDRIAVLFPAALIDILVFPLRRITGTGFGLDVVPPLVLDALAIGPDILAGDRASVTANTFIQMKNHRDL